MLHIWPQGSSNNEDTKGRAPGGVHFPLSLPQVCASNNLTPDPHRPGQSLHRTSSGRRSDSWRAHGAFCHCWARSLCTPLGGCWDIGSLYLERLRVSVSAADRPGLSTGVRTTTSASITSWPVASRHSVGDQCIATSVLGSGARAGLRGPRSHLQKTMIIYKIITRHMQNFSHKQYDRSY